jgi:hypothetical protein
VIARQVFSKRHPHGAGLAIAVQQNDRGPPAADPHIELLVPFAVICRGTSWGK